MHRHILAAASALALTAGAALAQDATSPAAPGPTAAEQQAQQVPEQARQFVEQAAVSGLAEVQFGQLAQDTASNDRVRQFAERMVQEHQPVNDELAGIASNLGTEMPTQLDPQHQEVRERLSGLTGEEFDQQYMQNQIQEHETAVQLFQQQSQQGEVEELSRFAETHLPTLQDHLDQAREIASEIGLVAGAEPAVPAPAVPGSAPTVTQ